ncbi:major facilitator superfamily domain-containing protein 6-like [Macrobrachium nipponense]|uniref:major facilitator superfamily domain-containing protein 6-like n=1 Tax=Macrobrachium nipponense TaxID=159736 RepID=UPI0030C80DA7
MKIDWELFPIKLHYLVRFCGTGPLTPFLPVIARHKGVSSTVISLIWTVMPFVSLISKTCAGALSDYFRVHRQVFLGSLMLMIVSFIGIYFTPDIVPHASSNASADAAEMLSNWTEPEAHNESHYVPDPESSTTGELLRRYEFWLLFLCLLGQYCGHITTITMQETICFSLIGDALHKYGEQRLWGTLGWGISAVAGGALVDWYSRGMLKPDYAPAYSIAVVFLTIDLVIVGRLRFSITPVKMDPKKVRGIFKIPAVLLVLITTVVVGASCGMIWTFQLLLVEDVAKMWDSNFPFTKLLQGILVFVQCLLSEMPFFYLAGHIIAKIGHFYSFFLALLAFCVRLCFYYTVTNPWWFIPIELVHGMSFGLAYATMASYANSITPKGAEATTQAIFGAAFFGGTGVGGLVGGWLFEIMTGWKAFLTAGIANGIYALIFLAIHLIISQSTKSQHVRGRKEGKPNESAAEEEMEKLQGVNNIT